MNKFVSVLLSVALALISIPAFASASDPVHITLWGAWAEDIGPATMIEAFNEVYPNIKVDYVKYTNVEEGNIKLDVSLLTGDGIDVFFNYGESYLSPRVANGMLLDLNGFVERDGLDIERDFGDFYTYNDTYYALPATSVQNSIYINKTLWDAADMGEIPTSWTIDEYYDYARRLTKGSGSDKIWGCSDFQSDNYWALLARGLLGDDYMYNADGLASFDNPVFKKCLEYKYNAEIVEGIQYPYSEMNSTGMRVWDVFLQGNVAMCVGSCAMARFFKDLDTYPRDFEVVVAPMPTLSADQEVNYLLGMYPYGYLGIAANIEQSKKEAAWTLLKWLCYEGNFYMAYVGHMPSNTANDQEAMLVTFFNEDYDKLGVDTDSFAKYVMSYDAEGYNDNRFVAYTTLYDIMTEEMENALYGVCSVDEAIKHMKTRGDEAVNALEKAET